MLQYKEIFLVEYNESLGRNLKRADVDWSQTRVVFVSTDFTENQIEATNFKDLSIELWQVKRYENETIAIIPIKKSRTAESIGQIAGRNATAIKTVATEIKTYTEDDLLTGKSDETVELYQQFRNAVLNLTDDIEIKPQKWYVAFKKNGRNMVSIEIQQRCLKLFINVKSGELDDPKHIARDVSHVGHYGTGDYELKVSDDRNLEYIMSLIKQAI